MVKKFEVGKKYSGGGVYNVLYDCLFVSEDGCALFRNPKTKHHYIASDPFLYEEGFPPRSIEQWHVVSCWKDGTTEQAIHGKNLILSAGYGTKDAAERNVKTWHPARKIIDIIPLRYTEPQVQ